MAFDSFSFIIFLTLAWIIRRLFFCPGAILLLIASVAFYAFAGWRDTLLIGTMILVNFGASFVVQRGRGYLAGIIAINIAVLAAFNLHLLLGSTEKLFAGELQGARGWSTIFVLRFTLFAGAIGIAIFSGIDPLGLILGFSTMVPSVVVATWKARPPVLETAGKGSRS